MLGYVGQRLKLWVDLLIKDVSFLMTGTAREYDRRRYIPRFLNDTQLLG